MIDLHDLLDIWDDRRLAQGPFIERMREIKQHYEGDVVLPLPELDRSEKAAVANLFIMGIDHHGMRISSVPPNVFFPPDRPGFKHHDEIAHKRKQAGMGMWEASEMEIKDGRRARWFVAYATSPVVIKPDRKIRGPRWHLRDPLSSYPAPTSDPDDMLPDDTIFAYTRTWGWLKHHHPEAADTVRRYEHVERDDECTVIEYIDAEEIVLAVVGERFDRGHGGQPRLTRDGTPYYSKRSGLYVPAHSSKILGTEEIVELTRIRNRADRPLSVHPGRITLDSPQGQFDGMIGMFQMQAKLQALEINAVARDVYPDVWLVQRQNEQAKVIRYANGITGVVGIVEGGDLTTINEQPGYMTNQTIDRLERNMRVESAIAPEFGGESGNNIRTGRRGNSILEAVVDFPVAEAQKVLARSKAHEFQTAIAVDKAYFGSAKKSFYVSWKGARGHVDYTPNEIWTSDAVVVEYPQPGTDVNGLGIAAGQRVGQKSLSIQSFMEMDPMVKDPTREYQRIVAEDLDRAGLMALQTRASNGEIPEIDLARMKELILQGMSWEQAVKKVDEETRERQSTTVDPAAPGSPEAMPGLANPGVGAEVGVAEPPTIPDLGALMGSLRRPHMKLDIEQGAVA